MNRILGYYICEKMKVPDWLGINRDTMISVSSCFGGVHPDLSECFFVNGRDKENAEYRKKWSIDDDKAVMLRENIGDLFEKGLAIDGRFLKLADAKYFCETYFDQNSCMIVSVSTTETYYDILTCDLADYAGGKNDFFSGMTDENELLGYDILGWDISGFHTFLCNHLQQDLQLANFNNFCLLNNDFREVEEFAEEIQDKGEPVEWVPCRIGNCFASANFPETGV